MQRKLIQLGQKTLLVSIPNQIIEKYGLKKGEDINIAEVDGSLVIPLKSTHEPKKIRIELTGKEHAVEKIICAYYKSGYDEIEAIYETQGELENIYRTISSGCIGFEIVEESNTKIKIKKISSIEQEEFDNILRRLYLILLSFSEDVLIALNNNKKEVFEKLVLRDANINKLSDFCRRVLNIQDIKKYRKTGIYHIVEELEKIGDIYKDICNYRLKTEVIISKTTLDCMKLTNEYLRFFYESFYNFDQDKILKMIDYKIKHEKIFEKNFLLITKEEYRLMYFIELIFQNIYELNGSLMVTYF